MKRVRGGISRTPMEVLVRLALPVVMSSLLAICYNMADIYWIGHVGSDAVAAVGSAGLFVNLGIALCSIVSMGAMVTISQSVGSRDRLLQNRYAATALALGLGLGISYSLMLLLFPSLFISVLDIQEVWVHDAAVSYLRVMGLGTVLLFANLTFTAILNAHGRTKLSFRAVLYGNIINMILDPLFIVVFDWGVEGAGIATVVAWLISFIYFYRTLLRKRVVSVKLRRASIVALRRIVAIGSASAIHRLSFTLITIFIGNIVASFGADAIAAQKVGFQVESLTFMIIGGLQQALQIVVGQSYGAGNLLGIRKFYRSAIKLGLSICVVTTSVFLLFPEELIGFFVDDPETIATGSSYLIILGYSQLFMTLEMITGGAFNGQGLTYYSATISIVFTVLRVPLAIILSNTSLGILGVWWSISITSMLKGVVSVIIYRIKYLRALRKFLKLRQTP